MDTISRVQHEQLRRWVHWPSTMLDVVINKDSPNPYHRSAVYAFTGLGLLNVPAIAIIQGLKLVRVLQAPRKWAVWSSETFLRRRLAWLVRVTGGTDAAVNMMGRNAIASDVARWLSVLSFGKDSIPSHQYWAIVTGSFVHFELQHFLSNMSSLYVAASTCVNIPGMNAWHVCAITLGSSVMATMSMMMQFRFTPVRLPTPIVRKTGIGASGVVTAFMVLAAMSDPMKRVDVLPFLPGVLTSPPNWAMVAMQFWADIYGLLVALKVIRAPASFPKNVGHAAHLGGAVVGVLYYTLVLRPRPNASSMGSVRTTSERSEGDDVSLPVTTPTE